MRFEPQVPSNRRFRAFLPVTAPFPVSVSMPSGNRRQAMFRQLPPFETFFGSLELKNVSFSCLFSHFPVFCVPDFYVF